MMFKEAKRSGSFLPLWELLSTPQGEATSHFPLAAHQHLWPCCPGGEERSHPER